MSFESHVPPAHAVMPQPVGQRLMAAAGRFAGGALLLAVAALWLSVMTWSVNDPSLTHTASNAPRNLMGPLGAIVSDLLLQTLGMATLVVLIVPLFWGFALLALDAGERRIARSQLLLFPVAALLIAGAVSALPVTYSWPLNHGFGGIVGDGLYGLLAKAFGFINAARGGMAAGFVLILTGLAALGRAIGLSRSELFNAVRSEVSEPVAHAASASARSKLNSSARIEPQLTLGEPLMTPQRTATAAVAGQVACGAGIAAVIANARGLTSRSAEAAQHHAARIGAGLASGLARAKVWYAPRRAVRRAGPLGTPYGHGRGHGGSFHAAAGERSEDALRVAEEMHEAEEEFYRNDDFDLTTEEASRAIARRFAPASAVLRARQELPEPPMSAPASQPSAARGVVGSGAVVQPATATVPQGGSQQPGRRNALFGGVAFRHQGPPAHKLPSLNLLKKPVAAKAGPEFTQTMLRGNARLLEDVLADFGVKGEVRDIRPGPVVTLYELEPARGTKSSRVIGLAEDIARSMSATAVRVAVVPGRNAIGIELPNSRRDSVLLREVLESDAFKMADAALPIALGKSIGGEPVVTDLARMPHLLVAGTTGSGKSVGVNAMILSLLYRLAPEDCRFLMIDPKMLELSVYNGIPHLLAPVVTDPMKAVSALNWIVGEMEERYKRMAKLSVRNIDVFNNRVRNAKKRGEMISRTVQTGFDRRTGEAIYEQEQMELETMPYIVVVIDEFADLMLVAGKEVEASVQRLAQMARAAGIHIIMATQRPSVDVITGTIKANFPTRISFKVASKIDSRTILNEQGAEQLLGQGDMLFAGGSGQVGRVHGAFVADEEVEAIANFLRSQGAPRYIEGITESAEAASGDEQPPQGQGEEDLYDRAVAIVLRDRKASTSYLQRRLSIGYNRAADLIERMEKEGLISAANNVGKREILAQAGRAERDGAADAA